MATSDALLQLTPSGLYCSAGNFYIDPWAGVDRAIVTHAHADHARFGSHRYLTVRSGEFVLRARLGDEANIETVEYGEPITINRVRVSLHPAGHILGSAQVRVEHGGEVWVVSGDYKVEHDPTCEAFEALPCHTFVTEATFALPVFRWNPQKQIFDAIHEWWQRNQRAGKASVLFGYALGKAQRVLGGLNPEAGPIFTHGAVERLNAAYRAVGVFLPDAAPVAVQPRDTDWSQAIILAPPSANGSPWMRRFGAASTGFVSGWMQIRGLRRRRTVDRGFTLSDHADWPGLLSTIQQTGAERIYVTHGYTAPLTRWLREHGHDAYALNTRFEGEQDDGGAEDDTPKQPDA